MCINWTDENADHIGRKHDSEREFSSDRCIIQRHDFALYDAYSRSIDF